MEKIINTLLEKLQSDEPKNCDEAYEILKPAFDRLIEYSKNIEYAYVDGIILKHRWTAYCYSAQVELGRQFQKRLPEWTGSKEGLAIVAVTLASRFLKEFPDSFYWGQEILFSIGMIEEKLNSAKLPPGNYSRIDWYHLLPEEKRPTWFNARVAESAKRFSGGRQLKADK